MNAHLQREALSTVAVACISIELSPEVAATLSEVPQLLPLVPDDVSICLHVAIHVYDPRELQSARKSHTPDGVILVLE